VAFEKSTQIQENSTDVLQPVADSIFPITTVSQSEREFFNSTPIEPVQAPNPDHFEFGDFTSGCPWLEHIDSVTEFSE
jgi:hypothetical protein